jgi:uncharacterized repeat protein (TIGR02543 family)
MFHQQNKKGRKKMKKRIVLGLMVSLFFLLVGTSYSAEIDEINAAIQAKGAKWVAGETSVSGLPKELKQRRASAKVDTPDRLKGHEGHQRNKPTQRAGTLSFLGCDVSLSACDWSNLSGKNFVTAIKDQGNCGACWAFAATELLESESELSFFGQNYWDSLSPGLIVTNLDLSPQIVLSCTNPSVDNCENGGYLSDAANFLVSYGTNLENCYPYTQTDGSCSNACSSWLDSSSDYYIYSWSGEQCLDGCSFTSTNCNICPSETGVEWYIERMKSLLQFGPLVAWMEVFDDFYSYRSGVYSCTSDDYIGNHFIEVIGWDDNKQAFHCKNSWGTGWGEGGFFWISYNELQSASLEVDNGATNFAHWVYWFDGGKHTPKVSVNSVPTGLSVCTLIGSSTECYNTPYQFEFETGSLVSVQAVSRQSGSSGCQYVFANWSNGAKTTTLTFTEPLVGGESYTAYFNTQYGLTTNPSGAGTVSPSGTTWHNANTSVSMSAKPSSGYTFYGWNGNVTGTKNPVSVMMSKPYNVTANFAKFSLVQPIGGATIPSGSTYQIQWNGPSNLVTYTVSYSLNGGAWNIMAGASGLTSPNYSWTVPVVTKATKCLIKVVAYNGKTVIKQLSSGAFTIKP